MRNGRALIAVLGALLLGLSCARRQQVTYVVICFDVEDYITPPEEGIDNIPKWLAETMSEVGVTGTFFVIGEKARSLEKRGRQDVIAAMAQHDIGSHTNRGSIHPTVTEQLENAGWRDGVELMLKQEGAGFEELERIFGVPVSTLARHGGSYGPQLVYALGRMGKGYVYSPIFLPGHNAVWCCNTLNFHGDYGYFDDFYYRDDLFEPRFDSLKAHFAQDIQGVDVLAFFGCHPCKVRTVQFWDFNYYYGANPDSSEWKTPELRPQESMKTARKNFRRLMEFLKEQEGIEITTFRELMKRFAYQPEFVSRKHLQALARRILQSHRVVYDERFSPAEIFCALATSLHRYSSSGQLPSRVERAAPLGPLTRPIEEPEIQTASWRELIQLVDAALDTIRREEHLPAWLSLAGKRIGTGSLLALFADAYLQLADGQRPDTLKIQAFDAYPKEHEEEIIQSVENCKGWPVHRRDLDMSRIVEYTRLQLWTLKPAREKP